MSLSQDYRTQLPRTVQKRFKSYWHAMHPFDFKRSVIYREGFTDEEWGALQVLKKRRSDCIDTGYRFQYRDKDMEVSLTIDLPKKYTGFPHVIIKGKQVSPQLRVDLAAWYHTATEWDDLDTKVHSYIRDLLRLDNEKRSINGINTIRQLYAIWPELLPFFYGSDRDTIRNTKVRAKLPNHWDKSTVELWMNKERMDEVNHALTVMTLIPDKIDEKYPQLG